MAPGRRAAAAAHRRPARVPISARRRRRSRAAPRPVRQPAARGRCGTQIGAAARPLAPGRARAPSATTRKTTDCAAALTPARPRPVRRGSPRPRSRAAASSSHGGAAGRRFRMAGIFRRRLVAAEQEAAVFRRLIAERGAQARRRQRACRARWPHRAEPPRDGLQLPDDDPQAEHDHPGASHDRASEDQGIAEAEVLARIPKADRHEAGQQQANPGDQHHNHHRTHPRAAPEMRAQPPTPRYRHIVRIANGQLRGRFPQGIKISG